MQYTIRTAQDLGTALRAMRKSARVRLDDLSQTVGVSKQTTTNVEQGKSTVQIGNILRLLAEVGLELSVDIPESAMPALRRLQEAPRRRRPGAGGDAEADPDRTAG